MTRYPVIDLHCDLLSYLNEDRERNNPMQEESRCSIPFLKKGGVTHQILAIFTETGPKSRASALGQLACYKAMLERKDLPCKFALAIENASGLLEEREPFEKIFKRFDEEKWLYVSLTWKEENRFGGGDQTKGGLKKEGEIFLEYMDEKGVAIDLSHASDFLAEGILNHIDKKGLKITPIANHSNFRTIKDHPRNLPDFLAKEIIGRGGVIGINFVRHFVGDKPEDFLKHIQHGLSLGGENSLVLGADFFGGISTPAIEHLRPFYQERFSNSSCYPEFSELLSRDLSPIIIEKIFYKNAEKTWPFL